MTYLKFCTEREERDRMNNTLTLKMSKQKNSSEMSAVNYYTERNKDFWGRWSYTILCQCSCHQRSFRMKSVSPEKEKFTSWQFWGCLGKEGLDLSELIQVSGTSVLQLGLCGTWRATKSQEPSVIQKSKTSSHLMLFFVNTWKICYDFINSCTDKWVTQQLKEAIFIQVYVKWQVLVGKWENCHLK